MKDVMTRQRITMTELKNELFAFQYRLSGTMKEYDQLLEEMKNNPTDDNIDKAYNFYQEMRPVISSAAEHGKLLSNFIISSDKLYSITDENKNYHKYLQPDLFNSKKE